MRNILLCVLLALQAACTHHPVRIDCDQRLEAINPSHPVAKPDVAASPP